MITANEIKEKARKGQDAVRQQIFEYWLNSAFLRGDQWLWWNPQTRTINRLPRDPARVQVTVNRLLPLSRTIIAKAMSRHLTFEVIPTAADDAAIRGSRLAEAVLTSMIREHDWESLRETAFWSVWKGGTAAIALDWDPKANNGIGDTVETVLSITEFAVEPGTRDAERARWWVKIQGLPPEEVQATFNLPETPAADAIPGGMIFPIDDFSKKPDLTLVYTYYERPGPRHPEGVVAVVVGDQIVDGPKPWPFPWQDKLNIVVTRETTVENRWYGDTTLSAARAVQVAFNASWSSIIEHMKLAGNARLLIPYSALQVVQSMTDRPGEILPYPDGTTPPVWITPPSMPAWWIEQPTRLANEMDDILGVHNVSRGEAPRNVESGFGLSLLIEQDQTPLTRMVRDQALAWGRLASMILKLLAKHRIEPREAIVKVPGQAPETIQWSGKDLMGQTNAQVPWETIVPRSRAAMMAFADKAVQMGLVQNVAQYARLADMPQQGDIIDTVMPDVAKARRENHALAQGKAVTPDSFDDHKMHIQEHNDFRKTLRYAILDANTRELIDLHVQAHETMAAEEAGRQVARQMVDPVLAQIPTASGSVTQGEMNVGRSNNAGSPTSASPEPIERA